PTMDYAIDMHKVIRFLTLSLSRDGYLNFMGNEFGHPEWIDFPREGNGWSYKYARRQWSLVNNGLLKYEWLYNFDRDMIAFVRYNELLTKKANCIWIDGQKKIIIFERGEFLFVFNLHPSRSQESVFVNCEGTGAGGYKVIFSSDERKYGGQDRADEEYLYYAKEEEYGYGFNLYVPCRTALVLKKEIK
ncbi:MAG: alpha amylase C-terminal domain-containing protein, partial [Clostridia bacterium]|nr:alpha amylase C-terminal domain-containing protein [Clostridia bacterium]